MGLRKFIKDLFGKDPEGKQQAEQQIRETTQKAADFTEGVGKMILEETKPVLDQLQSTSEELGKQILETGKDFTEKAADFTEDVGRKVLDSTAGMRDRLQNTVEELGRKILDDDKQAGAQNKDPQSFSSDTEEQKAEPFVPKEDPFKKYDKSHEEKSHLDALKETPGFGSGSFFDKASKFADGDYDAVKTNSTEPIIEKIDEEVTEKKPWNAPVHGFEDRDGDGDPLIDDAIIEEE